MKPKGKYEMLAVLVSWLSTLITMYQLYSVVIHLNSILYHRKMKQIAWSIACSRQAARGRVSKK